MTITKDDNSNINGNDNDKDKDNETQRYTVTLYHGGKRTAVEYAASDTLFDLCGLVADATGIERERQVLISGGKKLSIPESVTSESNVAVLGGVLKKATNAKLMMMVKPVQTGTKQTAIPMSKESEDPRTQQLVQLESQATALGNRVSSISADIDRHTKGFLDHAKTLQALSTDERNARQADEDAMRILETLDSFTFDAQHANNNETENQQSKIDIQVERQRAKRKAIVRSINQVLAQLDTLRERIAALRKDEFGEMAKRRGAPS